MGAHGWTVRSGSTKGKWMTVRIQCRCGTVQGEIDGRGAYARVTCYCRYCQAFAQWLGTPGLLDAQGGTDILAAKPSRMRITQGADQVACISLSKRVVRWYASCCRTPLASTAPTPDLQYVGVPMACVANAADVQKLVGPEGRAVANTESAHGPVRGSHIALTGVLLKVGIGVLGGRLRKDRGSPFFDENGKPIREPERIPMPEH